MCIENGGGFFSRSIKTGRNLGLKGEGSWDGGKAALIRTRTTQHCTMRGFGARERRGENHSDTSIFAVCKMFSMTRGVL